MEDDADADAILKAPMLPNGHSNIQRLLTAILKKPSLYSQAPAQHTHSSMFHPSISSFKVLGWEGDMKVHHLITS